MAEELKDFLFGPLRRTEVLTKVQLHHLSQSQGDPHSTFADALKAVNVEFVFRDHNGHAYKRSNGQPGHASDVTLQTAEGDKERFPLEYFIVKFADALLKAGLCTSEQIEQARRAIHLSAANQAFPPTPQKVDPLVIKPAGPAAA